jgi:hypothetical protein
LYIRSATTRCCWRSLLFWYGKNPTTKKRGCNSIEPDLYRLVPSSTISREDWRKVMMMMIMMLAGLAGLAGLAPLAALGPD